MKFFKKKSKCNRIEKIINVPHLRLEANLKFFVFKMKNKTEGILS